ncbi:CobW family GTP-binding protein [Rhizobium paknamense]|uniref:G3E family GTPase n=1 Tax=Rhizobium paknamense TaxID=1206817 RepID=A0ABU0IID9_9HYPH|nr:GTP-binding protein [Rhizobium paknamense]MDQ0458023.1 G3E family GTPase [Rhizobium paknamense]
MDDFLAFTPVTLITGFLGSGKTTLLKRLLAHPALADCAVLINEFGEIGLDHQLVERVEGDMVLLQSGCLCCTVRGELSEALRDLLSKRERGEVAPFRRIVIESTGLADPFPVLSTLKADPVLRHHLKAGRVITTIDAVNGLGQLDVYEETVRQAAIADCLVITKTDLLTEDTVDPLMARLSAINPDGRFFFAAAPSLDADSLIAEGADLNLDRLQSPSGFYCEAPIPDGGEGHTRRISAFSITVEQRVDWTAFAIWLTMLINRHGAKVLRVKGILHLEGEENPVAVHGVQHLVHPPVHLERPVAEDRRSHLVFIVDGLDCALLKRSFEAFTLAKQSLNPVA